jgi:hypothetical protein
MAEAATGPIPPEEDGTVLARKETIMHGKLMFGAGLGVGYVLGTRAGRERFSQISQKAKQFWENKTVQDAAGTVQAQAERLYEGGKQRMSDQTHRMQESRP